VDDKVIKEVSDELIEVINGCVCCTVRGDLVQTLKKLEDKISNFDGIIIETTGLADPAPIAQTFFVDDEVKRNYHLDGLITVVDAKHIMMHLEEEKPDGVENESVEQVAFADRILLNKCDLVDEDKLITVEKALKGINAFADIVRTHQSRIDPSKLLNIKAFDINRVLEMDPEFLKTDGDHKHDATVSSLSVHFQGELNFHQLKMWIRGLLKTKANDLFRYKGVLAVKGSEEKYVFQGVHMLFTCKLDDAHTWGENEVRDCRFVFIGRNLDKAELEKGIMECKVGPLRFQPGDCVRANVDGEQWLDGYISSLWDQGYPYMIEVELQPGTYGCCSYCWAPMDDDLYVRKREGGDCGCGG